MTDIDRAAFKRMGDGTDGCAVPECTEKPVITIGVTATEILDGQGRGQASKLLARRGKKYCARHGEAKFAQLVKTH